MKISDELIACYVEGNVTPEERNCVREYLSKRPQEMERVLYLMDNYTNDYLGERTEMNEDKLLLNESSFSNIAFSAAAFAPQHHIISNELKTDINSTELFNERLENMWDEMGNL